LFARQHTPASDLKFIPESKGEGDFFPRAKSVDKDPSDMKNVWALVEERKHEDRLLRTECGWGSQSGISASQVSVQQRCQSVDAVPYVQESRGEIVAEQSQIWNAREEVSQEFNQTQQEYTLQDSQSEYWGVESGSPEQQIQNPGLEVSLPTHRTPLSPLSLPRNIIPAVEALSGDDTSDTSSRNEETENIIQERQILNKSILDVVEENDEEDEGIPWF